jgi:hypothetical protein
MSQDGGASVVLRRERTRGSVSRLANNITEWLRSWKGVGPQTSQIMRCGAMLEMMTARLSARAGELTTGDDAFGACRAIDSDAAVVERLWRLFAERFGQRRDPAPAPVRAALASADELIWSCVQQVRPAGEQPQPLPLAYLEPAFSASATPRLKPPPSMPVQDRQLAEVLKMLPVPLIGLPVGVADEPWWLAVLAHEVGHHVQFDVDGGAVDRTQALLQQHAADDGWGAWRFEVFADTFSVVALGGAAIAVIAELEWNSVERMVAPAGLYPPVMVRLALMGEVAHAIGAADLGMRPEAERWKPLVEQIAGARRGEIEKMMAAVPAVVKALLEMPLGKSSLGKLADQAPTPERARVEAAMRKRLGGTDAGLERGKSGPRLAAAEAFQAYRGLAALEAAAARETALAALRGKTLALIDESADQTEIKRAPPRPMNMPKMIDDVFECMREVERE